MDLVSLEAGSWNSNWNLEISGPGLGIRTRFFVNKRAGNLKSERK